MKIIVEIDPPLIMWVIELLVRIALTAKMQRLLHHHMQQPSFHSWGDVCRLRGARFDGRLPLFCPPTLALSKARQLCTPPSYGEDWCDSFAPLTATSAG